MYLFNFNVNSSSNSTFLLLASFNFLSLAKVALFNAFSLLLIFFFSSTLAVFFKACRVSFSCSISDRSTAICLISFSSIALLAISSATASLATLTLCFPALSLISLISRFLEISLILLKLPVNGSKCNLSVFLLWGVNFSNLPPCTVNVLGILAPANPYQFWLAE